MSRTTISTAIAMTAFAANSVLCRMALGQETIDAASFTLIRLVSGALTLWIIVWTQNRTTAITHGDWTSAGLLFIYAVSFSFAYLSLTTGMGALILFGAVQFTMISSGMRTGERPPAITWFSIAVAMVGFVYLVLPGLTAPSPKGAALMTLAGVAWGLYSIRGRRAKDAAATTMGNFTRTIPFALLISLMFLAKFDVSSEGAVLAVLSGAIASGIGYVIWYAALPGLASIHAATVQLSVPVLAALGGILFLSEPLTFRLLIATIAILSGIAIVLWTPIIRRH